jgi:4-amino-4-deoxy-L-arabinose transferase-like glycosyltransferase
MSSRYLLIGLLCLAWILPGLVGHEPWKTDEAYTFGVIYDMLQGGSKLVPTMAGEPLLDEPPLYYWTAVATATLASPFLPLHDGARLASGLYMALTFLFCALAGRELHGKGQGGPSALLVLGAFGLILRGHEGITDIAPLAGYALAYYAWSLTLRRAHAGGLLLGMALGMVFLSQGVLETLILLVIALLLPLVAPAWRTRAYLGTVALALLVATPFIVALPWALHARSPALFAQWLLLDSYAMVRGSGRDLTFYLRILPWHAWPLWALVLWQLWLTRGEKLRAPAMALPLTGFAITLLMLAVFSGARDVYALTLLPAAARPTHGAGSASCLRWCSWRRAGFTGAASNWGCRRGCTRICIECSQATRRGSSGCHSRLRRVLPSPGLCCWRN